MSSLRWRPAVWRMNALLFPVVPNHRVWRLHATRTGCPVRDFNWCCALEPNCNLSLCQTNTSWAKWKNLRLNAVCSDCVFTFLCLIIKIVDYGVFNPETWLMQLCSQLQLSLILTQRGKIWKTPQRSISYSSLQPLSSSVSHKFWAVLLSCLVDAAVWPQRNVV